MARERILVTGSGGVLGQAFKAIAPDYPEYEWVFWTSRDCDLTSRLSVDEKFIIWMDEKPDYIIHCAAISGGVGVSKNHPATLLGDNVLMSINILEAARFANVKKVVMSLSSGMYPLPYLDIYPDWDGRVDESMIHLGPPHESNYAYAHAKRLIEPLIRSYREEYGLNAIGLVPNGIFGEHDNFNLEDCNMTAALIRKFYEASTTGGAVEIWGDGTPLRELTYAKDLARAYMWCLRYYDEPDILNVGNTEERSVNEIALMLGYVFGMDIERIKWNPSKPSGPYRKPTDNSKFIKLSGFTYTPFEEALKATVDWYKMAMAEDPSQVRTGSKVR